MAMKNGNCKLEEVVIKSPLGKIVLYGCEKGIHEIHLQKDAAPEPRAQGVPVSFEVCDVSPEMAPPMKQCTNWLQTYFCEPWFIEKVPTPAFHHPVLEKDSFTKTVLYSLMKNVKMGDTVSYKQLAEIAGNDKAARAVGGAMRNNPIPLLIPCHRVICSDGKTGNYSSGKANHLKEWLLAHEKLLKEM